MSSKAHWDAVYLAKQPYEVSWFQTEARISLDLIRQIAPHFLARILDVGGGASTLGDGLLSAGFSDVTVLDLSSEALEQTRRKLGASASQVTWTEANVLAEELPKAAFDVWHDRAVFHFLTTVSDRAKYVAQVRHAVRPGGHVLLATFAENGPARCSGLPVARYSPRALHREFGAGFRLLESRHQDHVTPSGAHQAFVYCLCPA